MALNGTFYGTTSNAYIKPKIVWSAVQSVAGNYSDVTATLYYSRTNSGYTTSGTWSGSITVAGSAASGSKYLEISQDSNTQAISHKVRVYHDAYGKKTITLSASGSISGTSLESTGISASVTLDTIARASTVGATDAQIGAKTAIAVSRKNSSFTHSIAYQFGTLSGYIGADWLPTEEETKLTATSISFRIPERFYDQIPNAPSGDCTLTCRTYSGDTLIGTAQTDTFKVTAAEDLCKPEVSGTVADINENTLALTGDAGKLVRYMSTARCTVTAQAKNGASLKSKAIGGVLVQEDTLTIPEFEGESVVFTAKDSRGYTGSHTEPVTLIPYIRLTCNASVSRTDPTGGKADLTLEGAYFSGSFGAADNALEVKCRVNGGEYMPLEPQTGENSYSLTARLTGLDYQSAHSVEVAVSDKLQTLTKTLTLGKGIPVFDWGENDFQFHVPVSIEGTVLDYVVEQGAQDIWHWRKWSSGYVELEGTKAAVRFDTLNASGNIFYGDCGGYTYPFALTEVYTANFGFLSTTGNVFYWGQGVSTEGIVNSFCGRGTSSPVAGRPSVRITGRWK